MKCEDGRVGDVKSEGGRVGTQRVRVGGWEGNSDVTNSL